MKINIYYGGRGLMDDPSLYVIGKMQQVFEELHVSVERFNLQEQKNVIATLPQTLKGADGIILAATVEWMGIGGYMQQFLDACWLYGDKEEISRIYMQPVVMATTYGEREASLTLTNAWEILGGLPASGLCGYVENLLEFEMNKDYGQIIEKKAEMFYRDISQKNRNLPTSNLAVKQNIQRTKGINLTPQESEQLSKYVSDDRYVKRQKEDIEELEMMFKGMLGKKDLDSEAEYIRDFENHFVPSEDFRASYVFVLNNKKKNLIVEIDGKELKCSYGTREGADVEVKLTSEAMDNIVAGRMTFQRAFMAGDLTAKGNFKDLRMLDQIFVFSDNY